jgi:transposase
LYRFYARYAYSGLLELHRLATTIETWWPETLTFLHTGITNAGSEGTNRVIKTVAREACGFRNRKPTATHQHRDHTPPPRPPQPP